MVICLYYLPDKYVSQSLHFLSKHTCILAYTPAALCTLCFDLTCVLHPTGMHNWLWVIERKVTHSGFIIAVITVLTVGNVMHTVAGGRDVRVVKRKIIVYFAKHLEFHQVEGACSVQLRFVFQIMCFLYRKGIFHFTRV